ncbi:MAG: IS5 family transposase [Nanoarchaeota archaeon]|nr:IS5 family transposase [Nanoarchaeota archaeon]
MDAKAPTNLRKERGLTIAQTCRIEKTDNGWLVPSQSGRGKYRVNYNYNHHKCSCPDHTTNKIKCKHLWAVEFIITKQVDGKTTCEIKTYPQNWKAYNTAQANEKHLFMKLLHELCRDIEEPEYQFGRPKLSVRDMVFCSAFKIYSLYSLRRFTTDMKEAKKQKYIDKVPCFASVSHFFQKRELTPVLMEMIKESSIPLHKIDTNFAVDSSGFGTTRFARYYSFKHGKDRKYKSWIKAHIICGTKTNIVTAVKLSKEFANDSPFLKELVEKTAENFEINEVSADKAYSSRKNLQLVEELGGTPFIPFKKNTSGKSRGSGSKLWSKMYHMFMYNHDEFMSHYHKRSNVETTFHMIKSKFGDSVRSKTKTAQINEVLLKILCHNIVVVIQEMYELGISERCFK